LSWIVEETYGLAERLDSMFERLSSSKSGCSGFPESTSNDLLYLLGEVEGILPNATLGCRHLMLLSFSSND